MTTEKFTTNKIFVSEVFFEKKLRGGLRADGGAALVERRPGLEGRRQRRRELAVHEVIREVPAVRPLRLRGGSAGATIRWQRLRKVCSIC